MKNIKEKLYLKIEKHKHKVIGFQTSMTLFILSMTSVFAEGSDTSSIDKFITFICDWLTKIGGVGAMFGGVMFAIAWSRDDADGKWRGLLILMAGFMVVAISKSPSIFGL